MNIYLLNYIDVKANDMYKLVISVLKLDGTKLGTSRKGLPAMIKKM